LSTDKEDRRVHLVQQINSIIPAVFYCAGHGFVGPDGYHYLIPWDAYHDASPSESLCVESVERQIQARNPKLLMFFLDICRRRSLLWRPVVVARRKFGRVQVLRPDVLPLRPTCLAVE
jgi:uncharacterized caspase-like protein